MKNKDRRNDTKRTGATISRVNRGSDTSRSADAVAGLDDIVRRTEDFELAHNGTVPANRLVLSGSAWPPSSFIAMGRFGVFSDSRTELFALRRCNNRQKDRSGSGSLSHSTCDVSLR